MLSHLLTPVDWVLELGSTFSFSSALCLDQAFTKFVAVNLGCQRKNLIEVGFLSEKFWT